jgi:hypothetical protein
MKSPLQGKQIWQGYLNIYAGLNISKVLFFFIMEFNLICELGPEWQGGYKIALANKTLLPSKSLE